MERLLTLHVERLPAGLDLATSDEVQGLVAQGRTIAETLEIARDVARRLLEAQAGVDPDEFIQGRAPRLAPRLAGLGSSSSDSEATRIRPMIDSRL